MFLIELILKWLSMVRFKFLTRTSNISDKCIIQRFKDSSNLHNQILMHSPKKRPVKRNSSNILKYFLAKHGTLSPRKIGGILSGILGP